MLNSFDVTRSIHTQLCLISERGSITKLLNKMFEKYPDFDFYHIANDDCIYHTPLWDTTLAKKGKITYGDDLLQRENLCTFPMIDGDIVRAVGWIQMPTLERYCGDVVWKFMANRLNILEYHPEVIIQHLWDGADAKVNNKDMEAFAEWLGVCEKDISKVKDAIR